MAVIASSGCVPPDASRFARAIPAVDGILDLYGDHNLVAYSEGIHGNPESHALLLSLLRSPSAPGRIQDIVVEWGNSRLQPIIDRYLAGEDVPQDVLSRVWLTTTQGEVWNRPVYPKFFSAIRELNSSLPEDRRYRVLLGDPPIESGMAVDRDAIARRDTFPASLIQREVLDKSRRGLIVYGGGHFLRKRRVFEVPSPELEWVNSFPREYSIVSILERTGTKVFSIWTDFAEAFTRFQPDIATWPTPSLARIAGTAVGAESLATYFPLGPRVMRPSQDGVPSPTSLIADAKRSGTLSEQFDAIVVLGRQALAAVV